MTSAQRGRSKRGKGGNSRVAAFLSFAELPGSSLALCCLALPAVYNKLPGRGIAFPAQLIGQARSVQQPVRGGWAGHTMPPSSLLSPPELPCCHRWQDWIFIGFLPSDGLPNKFLSQYNPSSAKHTRRRLLMEMIWLLP